MVTLKNNFGVEPDKDSVVMNVSEGSCNDAKSSVSSHPRAFLICCRNSHPFQARTIILNTPAKIGRSVARSRPSTYNGIFDCKVLSRNHAIIWYEYDSGKFMIQDTKSSNGTFINNQRLSKGGETSLPREFFSRDVVQFGVNVLETQRKDNEESDNCDETNTLVTHGCIVATVRLFHPNGKESNSGQPYTNPNPVKPISHDKICKLELIMHEAQQREGRIHDKLEELQLIIGKTKVACQENLTSKFEETRLLSKIANLEKQAKVMSKAMSGTAGKTSEKVDSEVQQLLMDIEKVQSVAREIQERQHRKLLEREQKLIEVQRVASNLELEVIALREQISLTELHLQEMGAKCTAYCQTIDILRSNFHAQVEQTQNVQTRLLTLERERDLKENASEDLSIADKCKFTTEEAEEESVKNNKDVLDNQEVILEQRKICDDLHKIEEKYIINEDETTERIDGRQAGDAARDVEKLKHKKNLEKLCTDSQELSLELEAAKWPVVGIEKTENYFESNLLFKKVHSPSESNEKSLRSKIESENEVTVRDDDVKKTGKFSVVESAAANDCRLSAEPENLNDKEIQTSVILEKENTSAADELGTWQKIQKMQSLLSNQQSTSITQDEIMEMKNTLNLLAEDLVCLLLRDEKVKQDNKYLFEKLNKSLFRDDIQAIGFAMHSRTIFFFFLTALAAYLIHVIFYKV